MNPLDLLRQEAKVKENPVSKESIVSDKENHISNSYNKKDNNTKQYFYTIYYDMVRRVFRHINREALRKLSLSNEEINTFKCDVTSNMPDYSFTIKIGDEYKEYNTKNSMIILSNTFPQYLLSSISNVHQISIYNACAYSYYKNIYQEYEFTPDGDSLIGYKAYLVTFDEYSSIDEILDSIDYQSNFTNSMIKGLFILTDNIIIVDFDKELKEGDLSLDDWNMHLTANKYKFDTSTYYKDIDGYFSMNDTFMSIADENIGVKGFTCIIHIPRYDSIVDLKHLWECIIEKYKDDNSIDSITYTSPCYKYYFGHHIIITFKEVPRSIPYSVSRKAIDILNSIDYLSEILTDKRFYAFNDDTVILTDIYYNIVDLRGTERVEGPYKVTDYPLRSFNTLLYQNGLSTEQMLDLFYYNSQLMYALMANIPSNYKIKILLPSYDVVLENSSGYFYNVNGPYLYNYSGYLDLDDIQDSKILSKYYYSDPDHKHWIYGLGRVIEDLLRNNKYKDKIKYK